MPILEKCEKCKRLGGFAVEATDKICARCKRAAVAEKDKKNNSED